MSLLVTNLKIKETHTVLLVTNLKTKETHTVHCPIEIVEIVLKEYEGNPNFLVTKLDPQTE